MTIDTQPVASQSSASTPQSGPSSAASNPPAGSTPEGFLNLILATGSKLQPGPEPPPGLGKQVEEAATKPNAKSQKLDSPQREKKIQSVDALVLPTGANVLSSVALQSQPVNSASSSPKPREEHATKTNSIQGSARDQATKNQTAKSEASKDGDAVENDSDDGVKSSAVLPTDPDVPIVDIKAFHATVPNESSALNPLNAVGLTAPANNLVAAKLAESNIAAAPKVDAVATQVANAEMSTSSPGMAVKKSLSIDHVVGEARSASPVGYVSQATGHQSSSQSNSGNNSNSQGDPNKASQPQTTQSFEKVAKLSDVVAKFETLMATRPKNGVTVELAPKELGSITFTLKSSGKAVDTHFSASNPEVRQALRESSPDLANSMQTSGYTVTGMSVEGQTAGSNSHSGQSQNQSGQHSAAQQPNSFLSEPTPNLVAASSSRSSLKAAGVDLWI